MEPLEQKIICTKHILNNGLTVWLNEDHTQPKVFGAVVVNAGAKDCPNTGIAHYFEHMMFKGTDKIGTVDYEKEKVLLDSIEGKYDLLANTKDESKRKNIQQEINNLSIKAAEFVIPNEFDKLISRYGGTKLNAGTSLDYTVYFNTFAPQYIAQWAEINSERLICPVFRLFQNELETVYEEKNMYGDNIGGISIDYLKERYFAPHPYAYPIIGSTENLKNPKLSEMRTFFKKYYVASNMGLILCGDFKTMEILPVLEQTFSRIPAGKRPESNKVVLPEFNGKEKMKLKVPMPFVKMMAMGFRGVPANHPDEIALKVAVSLLNNSNGTGLLDRLTVEHKVTAAIAINECMNEAGILAIFIVPRLLFQSYSSAEEIVWKQIKKIQDGEFSDEAFESLKLEQKREYASALEDISARAQIMMRVFSQGKKWEDYLKEIEHIDTMCRENVMEVAKKYFTHNYLYVTKTTGKYKKDNLPKPDYLPIQPRHAQDKSEYAKQLEKIPVKDIALRFINEQETHVEIVKTSQLSTVYMTPNPINDIFSLDIYYGIGILKQPLLSQLASYLLFIGTEEEEYAAFRNNLQQLGSTMTFEATDTQFVVHVSGFDNKFIETVLLIENFMRQAKAEQKNMRQVIDEMKVGEKAFIHSSESLAEALFEKVVYGNESCFLNKTSLQEVKVLKGKRLIEIFKEVQEYECSVHYCGNLPKDKTINLITQYLHLQEICKKSEYPISRGKTVYKQPEIFFLDMKDVSQSIVYGYVPGIPMESIEDRCASRMFTNYFGGDMSSIMFQEMREFRSYAYQVNGRYKLPAFLTKKDCGYLQMKFSTQSDKTTDALSVLNQLLQDMPLRPERMEAVRQNIRNQVNNTFPNFRDISSRIAFYRKEGFSEDPNIELIKQISTMGIEDIDNFYRKYIAGKPAVYAVVGNSHRIDMAKLSTFGTITKVKVKDIYK